MAWFFKQNGGQSRSEPSGNVDWLGNFMLLEALKRRESLWNFKSNKYKDRNIKKGVFFKGAISLKLQVELCSINIFVSHWPKTAEAPTIDQRSKENISTVYILKKFDAWNLSKKIWSCKRGLRLFTNIATPSGWILCLWEYRAFSSDVSHGSHVSVPRPLTKEL